MSIFPLLLLTAHSLALKISMPNSFGGKTEYAERGWLRLIEDLADDLDYGQPPTKQVAIIQEPTCFPEFFRCSTTYFGKDLTMKVPKSAQLWVKWHQDATPFACDMPNGCKVTSSTSIADLTSQTKGWSVTASLGAKIETTFDTPIMNKDGSASLSFQYSDSKTQSTTKTSTRTLESLCDQGNVCYLRTGTLMMTVKGICDSRPLIHCQETTHVCEAYSDGETPLCSQWYNFYHNNCEEGVTTPAEEQCSLTVAITGEDGEPVSFQVFEQKPLAEPTAYGKRDMVLAQDPCGDLTDGSSGAWMVWHP